MALLSLVLVLNAGSSSLKASVVGGGHERTPVAATQVGWGSDATRVSDRRQTVAAALDELWQQGVDRARLIGSGHRVVHGGALFTKPTLVDDATLVELDGLAGLAPLHNGVALDTLRSVRELLPGVPSVAVFDTAFHATLSPEAYVYPLPWSWYEEWGIRRFGFHGLSVEWSARRAAELLGKDVAELDLVVAHLGSGCSVTAVHAGRSVSTSMGLTPLEGLVMGTRSGSVDPGILIHVLTERGLSVADLADTLEHSSGPAGDVRRERRRARRPACCRRRIGAGAAGARHLRAPRCGGHCRGSRRLAPRRRARLHRRHRRARGRHPLGTSSAASLRSASSPSSRWRWITDGLLTRPGAAPAVLRIEAREDL